MKPVTHDGSVERSMAVRTRTGSGLALALVSATAFGLSGPLAGGLIEAGWSAGAAVTTRILLAAVVLLVPGLVALGGRWNLLRANASRVVAYGVLAVTATQLCFFYAISTLPVGVALLIEYLAPVAVIGWLWARHGVRPHRRTVLGATVAIVGLVLVLDLVSGADLDPVGVLWALGAMVGLSAYFVMGSGGDGGLPSITLAAAGLLVGGLLLLVAGVFRVVPWRATTGSVDLAGHPLDWWVPLLLLGVVTAAFAFATGIAAIRRLGSRVASFVGLTEVLAALLLAWLLLGQVPTAPQLVGGALVLIGVVVVRSAEPREPAPVHPLHHASAFER